MALRRKKDREKFITEAISVNPSRDPAVLIEPDKFKLEGKQYIRCCALAKIPKHTEKQTSIIWLYRVRVFRQIITGRSSGTATYITLRTKQWRVL